MNLKFLQKLRCLDWFKTYQALRRAENKVEFLEGQFSNENLSFVHKKESRHSFQLSLPFVSLLMYFQP